MVSWARRLRHTPVRQTAGIPGTVVDPCQHRFAPAFRCQFAHRGDAPKRVAPNERSGTVKGTVSGTGTLQADLGRLDVQGVVNSGVALKITNSALSDLQIDSSVNSADTVTFAGAGVLDLSGTSITSSQLNGFAGKISGLSVATGVTPTNEIDLSGLAPASITSATVSGSTITVVDTAGTFSLALANPVAGGTVVDLDGDGTGGTNLFLSTSANTFSTGTTAPTTVMISGHYSGVVAIGGNANNLAQDSIYIVQVTVGGFNILGETSAFPIAGSQFGNFADTVVLSGTSSYVFGTAAGDIDFINGLGTDLIGAGQATNISTTVVSASAPGTNFGNNLATAEFNVFNVLTTPTHT